MLTTDDILGRFNEGLHGPFFPAPLDEKNRRVQVEFDLQNASPAATTYRALDAQYHLGYRIVAAHVIRQINMFAPVVYLLRG